MTFFRKPFHLFYCFFVFESLDDKKSRSILLRWTSSKILYLFIFSNLSSTALAEIILPPNEIFRFSTAVFTGQQGEYEYFKTGDAACDYVAALETAYDYTNRNPPLPCGYNASHSEYHNDPRYAVPVPYCFAANWCNYPNQNPWLGDVNPFQHMSQIRCPQSSQHWVEVNGVWTCLDDPKCQSPYTLSLYGSACEAYCTNGETWDPVQGCVPKPESQGCPTQTDAPIDIIQGRKYRTELVIQTGIRYPFSLTYFFNNQRNQERTPTGPRFSVVTGDRYLAATKTPMTASEYQTVYSNIGVPTFSGFYRPTQHYGGLDQYWRHSFDEVLQIHGSQYVYQVAKGYEVAFAGLGSSAAYPHLQLQLLTSGEESFAGYKLTDNKTGEVKKFNSDGRLTKIERGPQDVLTLTYDTQNRLDRITNSEGAYIQLAYQNLATDSIYSVTATNRPYPISATNNRGESAQITWGKTYQGKIAKFHLITQITEATAGAPRSARVFEYNDTRWPASITDQYFVADISNSTNHRQTLRFEYDDLGRAVFSGLTGRASDAVSYVDPNTRTVTNALGKQATYSFADFNGVKRLQSVTGEPTQNCVSSEVTYEYYTNGNVQRKIQNGQITEYQYDSQNRETVRTEAAGTPQARTITTEYHPTLNKPIRIVEPGLTVEMSYDAEGRLLNTQKISTL